MPDSRQTVASILTTGLGTLALLGTLTFLLYSLTGLSANRQTTNDLLTGGGATVSVGDLTDGNAVTVDQMTKLLAQLKPTPTFKDSAAQLVDAGQKWNVNPLYLLAVTKAESSYGNAGAAAIDCHNPAGLSYSTRYIKSGISSVQRCTFSTRFAQFDNYGDSFYAQAWLVSINYLQKMNELQSNFNNWLNCSAKGATADKCATFKTKYQNAVQAGTLTENDPILLIRTKYAPPNENDTVQSAIAIKQSMAQYKRIIGGGK